MLLLVLIKSNNMNYLIVGTCGTGKTWVMKLLIGALSLTKTEKVGLYHFIHNGAVALLGKYDGTTFEGSDRLAMNIMADNEKIKPVFAQYTVVAEGDRFTNSTYITTFKPIILKIKGDGKEGRTKRGSSQTERHFKSITTRVNNITPNYVFERSEDCAGFLLNALTGGICTHAEYVAPKTTLF